MSELKEIELTAIQLLARREHSKKELRHKLLLRNFNLLAVDKIIEILGAKELQSDVRFTEMYVNARANRGYGSVRIRYELQARGISETLMEQYLKKDWIALARKVREKKFGVSMPKSFKHRAEQMKFLQYRGFTLDQIHVLFTNDAHHD